jgi:gamma-glutamyl-gamma-aminobutyrate hydrolase PuuD
MLIPPSEKVKERQAFSEKIFHSLLQRKKPVLGILREGRVLFDMFALEEKEIEEIASAVADCIGEANEQAPDFGYSRSY